MLHIGFLIASETMTYKQEMRYGLITTLINDFAMVILILLLFCPVQSNGSGPTCIPATIQNQECKPDIESTSISMGCPTSDYRIKVLIFTCARVSTCPPNGTDPSLDALRSCSQQSIETQARNYCGNHWECTQWCTAQQTTECPEKTTAIIVQYECEWKGSGTSPYPVCNTTSTTATPPNTSASTILATTTQPPTPSTSTALITSAQLPIPSASTMSVTATQVSSISTSTTPVAITQLLTIRTSTTLVTTTQLPTISASTSMVTTTQLPIPSGSATTVTATQVPTISTSTTSVTATRPLSTNASITLVKTTQTHSANTTAVDTTQPPTNSAIMPSTTLQLTDTTTNITLVTASQSATPAPADTVTPGTPTATLQVMTSQSVEPTSSDSTPALHHSSEMLLPELETTSSSVSTVNTSSCHFNTIMSEVELTEVKMAQVGMNLQINQSYNQQYQSQAVYVHRSTLRVLCSSEWSVTVDGGWCSIPSDYFCAVLEMDESISVTSRSFDEDEEVTIGLQTINIVDENHFNQTVRTDCDGDRSVSFRIGSNILSVVVYIGNESVPAPFHFTLNHSIIDEDSYNSASCSFWNTSTSEWSSSGCQTSDLETSRRTSCNCTHMTSFAILVTLDSTKVRDTISYTLAICGLCLSVVSLIASLVIYFILRHYLVGERMFIHVNLMVAVLLAHLTFSADVDPIQRETGCRAAAFILHYLYQAVICWILVESIYLCQQLVLVFKSSCFQNCLYILVGWGTPGVFVIISFVVKSESYGHGYFCWLKTTDGTIWAFFAPLIIIILANLIVVITMRIVIWTSRLDLKPEKEKQIKAGVLSILLLLPLLTIPWFMKPFVTSYKALEYIFIILNTLQGFFVAVMYCFMNYEVQRAALERWRKFKDSDDEISENAVGQFSLSANRVTPSPDPYLQGSPKMQPML